jgi:hypothetical protein
MSGKEIEGVREIVLVTQGVLPQTLLGRGYRGHGGTANSELTTSQGIAQGISHKRQQFELTSLKSEKSLAISCTCLTMLH